MKIIWIDGTFGCGKTSVANAIEEKLRNVYLLEFDALQMKYKPNSVLDFYGERYPEAKRYLINALINEMVDIIQEGSYDFLVIPIALINDYCNEKLINGFVDIESYHFILTASKDVLYQRINTQENRDADLAITYMPKAITYLSTHYFDAIRIDTSDRSINEVAENIVKIILS